MSDLNNYFPLKQSLTKKGLEENIYKIILVKTFALMKRRILEIIKYPKNS